jgi:uncharacterized small protein (DUF1192 family)
MSTLSKPGRRQVNFPLQTVTELEDRIDCINRNIARLRLDIREIVHEEVQNVVKEALYKLLTSHWEEEKIRHRERVW